MKRFFGQYAKFTGRASKSEFWWSQLGVFAITLIPNILTMVGVALSASWASSHKIVDHTGFMQDGQEIVYETAPGLVNAPTAWLVFVGVGLSSLVLLAVLVPQLAVLWRRLHDANFAGPFAFLGLIPTVGGLIVLVLTVLPSKVEGRRFDTAK